jgi:hypothetical protein
MLTKDEAQAAIAAKIEENGASPESVVAYPKGEGVWFAEVKLVDDDRTRQGIFLDADLTPVNGG